MPVPPQLLEILVCPVSRLPVALLDEPDLARLNRLIARAEIKNVGGEILRQPLAQALITRNRTTIYPVVADLPIMVQAQAIAAALIFD